MPQQRIEVSGGFRLAILLFAASALLCPPLLAAQQSPSNTSVQGTVINAVTHQPIARALVSLDQYGQAMLTDNEGRFNFDGVPAGETTLSARRPGFSADDSGNSNSNRQVITTTGSADTTIELTPQSSITGELILPGDDSPDSLQLQLLHQEIQNGRGHWSLYRNAEANSEGRFRFGDLPSGAYLVHVGASIDPAPALQPQGASRPRTGYVPAFYPGVREIAGAGVVTLTPGQQADIKMELTREPFYPVTLPVANYDDARGIGFEVSSDSFLGLPARFSPQDGLVHIDLPNGHYLLEAHGYGSRPLNGQREFDVNGGQTRAGAITLLPASRIPVTVHAEFSHPQAQAEMQTQSVAGGVLTAASQISLELQRLGNGPATHGQRTGLQDEAGSSSSGVSELAGVSPGRYWVNASAFNGYIAAMSSGGVDLLQDPFTVAPGGSAPPIEVTLRDDFATISANLASTLQSTGAGAHPTLYLQLIPLGGAATARAVAFAADGTATLANLPPGSYLAFAAATQRQIAYRSQTFMASMAARGQTVSVEPGGSAHLTIDSVLDLPGGAAMDTSGGGP